MVFKEVILKIQSKPTAVSCLQQPIRDFSGLISDLFHLKVDGWSTSEWPPGLKKHFLNTDLISNCVPQKLFAKHWRKLSYNINLIVFKCFYFFLTKRQKNKNKKNLKFWFLFFNLSVMRANNQDGCFCFFIYFTEREEKKVRKKRGRVPGLLVITWKHLFLFSFSNPPGTHAPFGFH